MNPPLEETDRLIGRYLDGLCGPEECDRLSALLAEDASVRARYLDLAEVHATLAADESLRGPRMETAPVPPPVNACAARKVARFPAGLWLAGAAAAVVLAGIGIRLWSPDRPAGADETPAFAMDGPLSERVESAEPVAVLKRSVGVEWKSAADSRGTGETLSAGWLRLNRGTVQVEFLSGARLLIEGPAEVRLDSENSAFLQSGKASAHVPEPAHGFQLHAPGMEVEDLGTAFGLEVTAGKAPEVHVFDGSVSLSTTPGSQPETVAADRAVKLENASFRDVPLRAADFPSGEDLARRAVEDSRVRLATWRQAAASLAEDPDALACFSFDGEPEWQRTVTSRLPAASEESSGTLVGAAWTSGRWPGKQAVEFRSRGDRLRFAVPGTHAALTLMVWVRVDSLTNDYNSLLLPTEYTTGSLHWTIERGGEMRLTMLNDPAAPISAHGWDGPVSAPAISSMDFGRWIFLATTYDSATGDVRHYCDGHLAGSGTLHHRRPAVLGNVEFGNWGADSGSSPTNQWWKSQPASQRVRNFVGRLDALTILRRALSSEEITALHESGRP